MSQKTERVVVTGMGVASPLGCNLAEFWDGLITGRSGVGFLDGEAFSELPHKIGAAVWGYEESQYFDSKESRRMSRSSQLGLVAAQQAISEAKLNDGAVDCTQIGIMVGSSIGGFSG